MMPKNTAPEHPGSIIAHYYYDANDTFQTLPDDWSIESDGSSISHYYLPGVELTNMRARAGLESRFMRFKGLAQHIGRAELTLLGVDSDSEYPDLIVACPGNNTFPIVPSEAAYHNRSLRRLQGPLEDEDPWLTSS